MIALSNTLNFELVNQLLWLIAIILKFVIGAIAFALIMTLIFGAVSLLD